MPGTGGDAAGVDAPFHAAAVNSIVPVVAVVAVIDVNVAVNIAIAIEIAIEIAIAIDIDIAVDVVPLAYNALFFHFLPEGAKIPQRVCKLVVRPAVAYGVVEGGAG